MNIGKILLPCVVALLAFGLAIHPNWASAQSAEDVEEFEEPEHFTEFSETTAEVLSVEEHDDEILDLTNLSPEEAKELDDEDYMEYQMQTGNYTIEEDGTVVIPDFRSSNGDVSVNCIACAGGIWKVKKMSGSSIVYGPWRTIASGWGPGSLERTISETRSNSYTGTLKASKSAVDAAVGFNITKSRTVTVTYRGQIKSGKQGFLQVRPVYTKYTVRQQYVKLGQVKSTVYIYPRKFSYPDHRIGY